ncbi:unnamed protein product, partial [Rotaria magnacalcarata]
TNLKAFTVGGIDRMYLMVPRTLHTLSTMKATAISLMGRIYSSEFF